MFVILGEDRFMEENFYNIGIFDSGVGGISVLKKVLNICPHENIIYYGDTIHSPYGEKTEEEIQNFCINIMNFFTKKKVKVVLIACNTATAAALNILQKKYKLPIIGIIGSGARLAVEQTKSRHIGVFSTVFTAKTLAYQKEIKKITKDIHVYEIGCPEFCPMIENGWENFNNREELIEKYVKQLPEKVDTLVLGCTHYPLVQKDFEKYFLNSIVDPAEEMAKTLSYILFERKISNSKKEIGKVSYYVSGDLNKFKKIAEVFLEREISRSDLHQV